MTIFIFARLANQKTSAYLIYYQRVALDIACVRAFYLNAFVSPYYDRYFSEAFCHVVRDMAATGA
jgi:hypothetical protein